jgi:hypothetical protein
MWWIMMRVAEGVRLIMLMSLVLSGDLREFWRFQFLECGWIWYFGLRFKGTPSGPTPSTSSSPPSPTITPKHHSIVGVVVGPVIGIIALLLSVVGLLLFYRRKRQQTQPINAYSSTSSIREVNDQHITPFADRASSPGGKSRERMSRAPSVRIYLLDE